MTQKLTQPGKIDSDIYQAAAMTKIIVGNTNIRQLIEESLPHHPKHGKVYREQLALIRARKQLHDNSTEESN